MQFVEEILGGGRGRHHQQEGGGGFGGGDGYPGGRVQGGGGYEGFQAFNEGDAQRHYEQVYMGQHERHHGSLTHEAIAGAAGFAAMHAYEAHLRATGQPVSHGKMKEILAAIAAAEVDKLAETKGLDHLDRHRAKKYAEHQAHMLAEQRYGHGQSGWEYMQNGRMDRGPCRSTTTTAGLRLARRGAGAMGGMDSSMEEDLVTEVVPGMEENQGTEADRSTGRHSTGRRSMAHHSMGAVATVHRPGLPPKAMVVATAEAT
ncbi:hypothetical protein B0H11DRAFT_2084810, partial [Mycena galericulata]